MGKKQNETKDGYHKQTDRTPEKTDAVNKFKDRLRAVRESYGLTQIEASKKLGISEGAYKKHEQYSGTNRMESVWFMYDLCRRLNVSADYLLGLTDEPSLDYAKYKHDTGLTDGTIATLMSLKNEDDNAKIASTAPMDEYGGFIPYRGLTAFLNCFIGNGNNTEYFLNNVLLPILQDLYESQGSYTLEQQSLSRLSNAVQEYIRKVVMPTYIQAIKEGAFDIPPIEDYLTDDAVYENEKNGNEP